MLCRIPSFLFVKGKKKSKIKMPKQGAGAGKQNTFNSDEKSMKIVSFMSFGCADLHSY